MADHEMGREAPGYRAAVSRFPSIPDERRRQMLALPAGPVRVVIDTDAKNEIDDQFALTWALLSQNSLRLEAVYAAPFSFALYRDGLLRADEIRRCTARPEGADLALVKAYATWLEGLQHVGVLPRDIRFDGPDVGMERSYQEILTIFDKLRRTADGLVFRGSERFLSAPAEPVRSPAAEHLIARALANLREPLYVVVIGAVTNVVSAMLLEPAIIQNMVVVWTSSYPSVCRQPTHSLNLEQDLLASQLLFDCGVPLVYLPGHQVGAQLRISLPEMDAWVRGRGEIGDYLYWLYTNNPIHAQRGIAEHFGRTWIMWDLINIAWLLNPDWVPSDLGPTPVLSDDKYWQPGGPERHWMREAYGVDRDAIFRDFLAKLHAFAG